MRNIFVESARTQGDRALAAGKNHVGRNRISEAIDAFTRAVKLNPSQYEPYFELGKCYLLSHEDKRAVFMLNKAHEIAPQNTLVELLLAKAYKGLGEYAKARDILEKEGFLATLEHEFHGDALFERASIYYQQKDYNAVRRAIKDLLAVSPSHKDACGMLATIEQLSGNYREAAQLFQKVLDRGGSSDDEKNSVFYALGHIYYALSEYRKSISYLKNINNTFAGIENAYLLLAKTYALNGMRQEALETYALLWERAHTPGVKKEIYKAYVEMNEPGALREFIKYLRASLLMNVKENKEATKQSGNDAIEVLLSNILENDEEIASRRTVLASKVRNLTVSLTSRCNLDCIMCGTRKTLWDLPDTVADEVAGLLPCLEKVLWQGGESFLYRRFDELIDAAARSSVQQEISTNGLLLNDAIAEKIARYNINLTLSIDGVDKQTYERVRRGGNFEKLLESLNVLNSAKKREKSRITTSMRVIVMKSNFQKMDTFLEFAKKYGFNTVFFDTLSYGYGPQDINQDIRAQGLSAAENMQLDLSRKKLAEKAQELGINIINYLPPKEYIDALTSHQEIVSAHPCNEASTTGSRALFCHKPWNELFIHIGGDVRPSCMCPQAIGNVHDEPISVLWNNAKIIAYREAIIKGTPKAVCSTDCVYGRIPKAYRCP